MPITVVIVQSSEYVGKFEGIYAFIHSGDGILVSNRDGTKTLFENNKTGWAVLFLGTNVTGDFHSGFASSVTSAFNRRPTYVLSVSHREGQCSREFEK